MLSHTQLWDGGIYYQLTGPAPSTFILALLSRPVTKHRLNTGMKGWRGRNRYDVFMLVRSSLLKTTHTSHTKKETIWWQNSHLIINTAPFKKNNSFTWFGLKLTYADSPIERAIHSDIQGMMYSKVLYLVAAWYRPSILHHKLHLPSNGFRLWEKHLLIHDLFCSYFRVTASTE